MEPRRRWLSAAIRSGSLHMVGPELDGSSHGTDTVALVRDVAKVCAINRFDCRLTCEHAAVVGRKGAEIYRRVQRCMIMTLPIDRRYYCQRHDK